MIATIDEIIKNVLKEASKELEKIQESKKGTRKRRVQINILEGQQEENYNDNTNEDEDNQNVDLKDLLPYSTIRNYNWFNNFVTRRENKKDLMPSKQGSTYLVFNKTTSQLVLTYNTETSEVRSTFDVSTILGVQQAKK